MIVNKTFLIILFNVTCCTLARNNTSVISSDIKSTEIVTEGNNTITIFNKCCDDDQVFDVIGKRCVPVKNFINESTYFDEQKVYIGE